MSKLELAPVTIPLDGMNFVQCMQDFGVTLTSDDYQKVHKKLDKKVAGLEQSLQPSPKITQMIKKAKIAVIGNLTNTTKETINQILLGLEIEESTRARYSALIWKGVNPTNVVHPQKLTIDLIMPDLIKTVVETAKPFKPRQDAGQIAVLFGFLHGLDDAADFYTSEDILWNATTSALLYPDRNIKFPENPFLTNPFSDTSIEQSLEPDLITYAQQMRSFGQRSVLRIATLLYPQVVMARIP